MNNIIRIIQDELDQNSEKDTRVSFCRFFKDDVKCHGVKTAFVKKMAKKYYESVKQKDKREIFSLCEQLLKSDYCEEAFIAFDWAYRVRKKYESDDFKMFEYWIGTYVNNWAKCDTLCNHSMGYFIEQFPQYINELKCWTKSGNRWLRRASAVTLILPARKGKFLEDIFQISDKLLKDDDDLVQKGYGWMLKEASRIHQREVFDYVMKNKKDMPRTALRYSIEKLPKNMRILAMEK